MASIPSVVNINSNNDILSYVRPSAFPIYPQNQQNNNENQAALDEYLYNRRIANKWGVRHIMLEIVVIFISFYVFGNDQNAGLLLVLSAIFAISGSSMPLCCCPTGFGWKLNLIFQTFSLIIIVILFLLLCLTIATKLPNRANLNYTVVFMTTCIFSILSTLPFIRISQLMISINSSITQVRPLSLPEAPVEIMVQQSIPQASPADGVYIPSSPSNSPQSPVAIASPWQSNFHSRDIVGNNNNYYGNSNYPPPTVIATAIPVNDYNG